MTLDAQIAALTTATTDLLDAVNVRKSVLDAKVDVATAKATEATTAASTAQTAATTATSKEETATAAANTATTAATTATDKAAVATTKANDASLAATTASTKATEAATAAATATTQATLSTTKATEAAASALSAVNAPGTSGTSTTSMTVGSLGSFTFTTQGSKSWVVGQYVTIAQTAAPLNSMFGQITAYNSTNGSMTVQVTAYQGTGTATAWTIALSAPASPIDASDIGTEPNQIPLNQYLGTLAFQDKRAVNILGGVVNAQIRRGAPVTKTAAFTVADTEHWFICNGTAAMAVTLPDAATSIGREIMFKTITAFAVNSAASNVVPLVGGTAGTAILPATAGKWAKLVSDGTNWIIMQAA